MARFAVIGFSLLIAASSSLASSPPFSGAADDDLLEAYQSLRSLPFDDTKTTRIKNLTLTRNRGKLHFLQGSIFLCAPVAGQITGAVFLGEGVFELTPPTRIERAQVARFLDADSIRQSFTAAYLRFTDATAAELAKQLDFEQGKVPKTAGRLHKKVSKILLERGVNLASLILRTLANADGDGLFLAALEHTEESYNFPSYFILSIDPHASENVAVFQAYPHRPKKPFYTLCSFHSPGRDIRETADEKKTGRPDENKADFRISHYKMNVVLKKNGHLAAEVELSITPQMDSLRVLAFDLFEDLRVDSVRNVRGDSLALIQEKKEATFAVLLDEPTTANREIKLRVWYAGKLLEEVDGGYAFKNKLFWYPRHGYLQPATFDVTYKCPKRMQVLSGGQRVKQWQEDGDRCTLWVETIPSDVFAFALGRFDSTAFVYQDSLAVTIYSQKRRSGSVRKKIGADVISSLYFFQQILGEYPYPQLTVVEMPGRVSNGFPGILFLTSLTYSTELQGVMQALRAHEVSHQWWGNLIGWQSYHDQWLSEGFAEYSGALMVQFLLDNDERFFEAIAGWRNDLLSGGHIGVSMGLRRFGFSKSDLAHSDGLEAGPIWLGQRLGTKHPIDYFVNVYEKGAFVMHMLRTMLRDFETGSDARFWRLLADFVRTFRGQKANTADFERMVDKHFGQDMSWFFEQWLYGTGVPTYVHTHKVQRHGPAYFVELQVEQKEVPAHFKAFVPVTVVTIDREKRTEVLMMTGEQRTFRLGPFLNYPKKIVFNAFEGVLARVKSR
ncbi:MAG: M1 family metallopeptidase [bacterium]